MKYCNDASVIWFLKKVISFIHSKERTGKFKNEKPPWNIRVAVQKRAKD